MRCTLKDGVFFKPKKKKNLIKSKREQGNDVILPYILKINQTGSNVFTAVQHPEVSGTWAEMLEFAQKTGYSGVHEQSGLRRKKTFPKVEISI